jgi:hypothetical protein
MSDTFDPGQPITAGDLIEDGDGAPLPHELQRGGAIWTAVATVVDHYLAGTRAEHPWASDQIMVALAPILWPLLPSNDHSPTSQLDAVRALIWRRREHDAREARQFVPIADLCEIVGET